MMTRFLREVDPYQDFLCRQRQATSPREEGIAQYLQNWERNWNRNGSEENNTEGATSPQDGQFTPNDEGSYNGNSINSGAGSEDGDSYKGGSRLSSEGSLHVGGSQLTVSVSSRHSSSGGSGYNSITSPRSESSYGGGSSYRGGSSSSGISSESPRRR